MSSTDLRFDGGNLLLHEPGIKAWGSFGRDPGLFYPKTPMEAEKMALAFQMAAVHLREVALTLPKDGQ